MACPPTHLSTNQHLPSVCSIVYNLWSGYFRCNDASFMGFNRAAGWRGGRRFLREFGHGAYLVWNLAQVPFLVPLRTLPILAEGRELSTYQSTTKSPSRPCRSSS